ncbi:MULTISPECIES: hypothetical protein [unclassified Microbacterium]|uniref:hypothetical protein n=1 Tax=unclassified Microbacterium TaxID=2609290 RepID=UPI0012F904CF|nr:hypothetical protein [Microbacterium sp. MAH-37]MVQ41357.1 hypothetical protein [Microbacterium sp. MAH-37]
MRSWFTRSRGEAVGDRPDVVRRHGTDDHSAAASGISRRNVVTGGIWSVPIIAAAVGTPLAAASAVACPEISDGATWATAVPAAGTSVGFTGAGVNAWGTVNERRVWRISRDADSTTEDAYAETYTTIDMVAGVEYTFSLEISANYAYYTEPIDPAAGGHEVQVQINGQVVQEYTTRTAWSPRTQIPLSPPSGARVWTTFTFTYTATSTGPAVYRYLNRLGATTTASSSDDVFISQPVLVACIA